MCAGVRTISLITFGVQPSTPTFTLLFAEGDSSSNRTADVFLFKALTSTVVVLLVVRRGRDGVSRACITAASRATALNKQPTPAPWATGLRCRHHRVATPRPGHRGLRCR